MSSKKLRAGESLNAKEKTVHDQGLVTLLRQIHDELDAAVLEAYGWADLHPLTPEREAELLTRLVALNHERAAEEQRGHIRWLRPDYQAPVPAAPQAAQPALPGTDSPSVSSVSSVVNPSPNAPATQPLKTENSELKTPIWPPRLPEQVALIRQLLAAEPTATAETLSACFGRKSPKRTEQIEGILETLRGLGHLSGD